ncbi:hypothetical protein D3Z51_03850 [Clostridiaceae bacterium]|nr:hypothetical protein [Clostridiaceae bacterium]RKI16913.1 hypothetical protein D7V81_04130 [bacterium 1XD21-70]
MYTYIDIEKIVISDSCRAKLESLFKLYMQHKFNLLGSGFVKIDYSICAKGLHGKRYKNNSMKKYGIAAVKILRRKYKNLLDYEPINWFVDYKSGFFFDPKKYNSVEKCTAVISCKLAVDIKSPWELGRFYHLVQMAMLAIANEEYRTAIIKEFKNEALDFIEMNPIGKTVQWSAVMDSSIRIVNLLVAYDILKQLDDECYLDHDFGLRFEKLIKSSLEYIINRLEKGKGGIDSNHYLSNLVGVIFASAYLEIDEWTNACLVFGTQEIIDQVWKQFYREGSHFEGSTSYHRLSGEFVLYSTALIYGVLQSDRKRIYTSYKRTIVKGLRNLALQKYNTETENFFPEWYLKRIYNMAVFTSVLLKNNNEIVQIGDNDSGRLLKLTPMGKWKEDKVIDHRDFISAVTGLFNHHEFESVVKETPLEASLVHSLANKKFEAYRSSTCVLQVGFPTEVDYPYKKETILYVDQDKQFESLLDGLRLYYYSAFGILVAKSRRLFICIVIDTAENTKILGHTHNDKLSIEVLVDGTYITRDPGGYIYTAFPDIRDKFRSVKAHNVIHVGDYEQNVFWGTFGMKRNAAAQLLFADKNKMIGKVTYGGVEHVREITLSTHRILVTDYANVPFKVSFRNKIYSTGYGQIHRCL